MRLLFIVALGCGAPKDTNPPVPVDTDTDTDADSDTDTDTDSDTDTDTAPPVLPDPVVVTVTTRDSVDLVADYYAASGPGRPGVVLLHMIPPSNDRSSWPVDFVTRLQAHDWGVVVVDRRGAGDSGGVAVDAYTGEWGRYDVEACVLQLVADGATEIVLIGASNGTTSALDYAAWAAGEGLPVPAALGFMTGGTYTDERAPVDAGGVHLLHRRGGVVGRAGAARPRFVEHARVRRRRARHRHVRRGPRSLRRPGRVLGQRFVVADSSRSSMAPRIG
jgi:pimeloyl-ACP methyl ester carboxylesterase